MAKVDLLQGTLDLLILRGAESGRDARPENNRRAKYYRLTKAGKKQLAVEQQTWERLTGAVAAILRSA